jgi:hypothetical protein
MRDKISLPPALETPASENVAMPVWQESAVQQRYRDARARRLAGPQVEIEQRVKAEFTQ